MLYCIVGYDDFQCFVRTTSETAIAVSISGHTHAKPFSTARRAVGACYNEEREVGGMRERRRE